MEKISILCPTRRRPDSISNLVFSILKTAKDVNFIEIIFYVDWDDKESIKFLNSAVPVIKDMAEKITLFEGQVALRDPAVFIDKVLGPRIILSQCWNECYKVAKGDILMHCGDDIRFRTNSWDEIVRREFDKVPDKIVQVFGDDGIQHEHLATHSFIHRKWAEAIGYFVPPYFSSDYNDTWLDFVARQLKRQVYKSELITEHMHWLVGKGEKDETALENLSRHVADNVEKLYASLFSERINNVKKLQQVIDDFQIKSSGGIS